METGKIQQRLQAERNDQLCRILPTSIVASLLIAAIYVGAIWGAVPRWRILVWYQLLLLISGWRLAIWLLYRRIPAARREHDLLRLTGLLRISTLCIGAAWGSAAPLLFTDHNSAMQMFLAVVLAGVSSGAAVTMAPDRRCALYFQLAALLPTVVRLLITEDRLAMSVGSTILLYTVYICASIGRLSAHATENIQLRLNADEREALLHTSEAQLRQLAHHDALTNLLNRHSLQARLPQLIEEAGYRGSNLALFYLDLDNFKQINDSLGHDAGDQLLVEAARRLRHATSADDLVVRMGGDEFVVVTTYASNRSALEAKARLLHAEFSEPVTLNGEIMHAPASIGVALYPDNGHDVATLLKHADIALYQAKEAGRDTYRFFSSDMSAPLLDHIAMEQALRLALQSDELSLEYQPIVDLSSGRLVALEALARWQNPQRGSISSAVFVPLAERSGLSEELDDRILQLVCLQLCTWQQELVPMVPVAVNITSRGFKRCSLNRRIKETCARYEVDPALIRVEIGEEALLLAGDAQRATLDGIRALGVQVTLDDFGTGYSNLAAFKSLPIDALKIDRSLIHEMVHDTRDAALVRAIVEVGRALGIQVVAGGVESVRQADELSRLGCPLAQGHYFHRPVAADQCSMLLNQLATSASRAQAPGPALVWTKPESRQA